jgi:hypothetical protein
MFNRHPAYRTYQRRMALAAVIYVAAIFAAASTLHHRAPPSGGAIAVALVPGLAVLFMIYAIARMLIDLDDEFLRLLEVRKALVATALTLAVCSVWGLLEIFTAVPPLPVFWVFPGWAIGLFAGALVNRVTVGAAGCA